METLNEKNAVYAVSVCQQLGRAELRAGFCIIAATWVRLQQQKEKSSKKKKRKKWAHFPVTFISPFLLCSLSWKSLADLFEVLGLGMTVNKLQNEQHASVYITLKYTVPVYRKQYSIPYKSISDTHIINVISVAEVQMNTLHTYCKFWVTYLY